VLRPINRAVFEPRSITELVRIKALCRSFRFCFGRANELNSTQQLKLHLNFRGDKASVTPYLRATDQFTESGRGLDESRRLDANDAVLNRFLTGV
jgi:hypothetical protein